MRIVFFAQCMPDPCGAFFHDVILSRALQARGHSVHWVTVGKKFPREGVYKNLNFSFYENAGKVLNSADILCCPHFPFLPFVRKLNEAYEKPIMVTMHYGEDTLYIENCPRTGKWAEFLYFVSPHIEKNVRSMCNINPSFIETGQVRPMFLEQDITLFSPPNRPTGECITLINANVLKGLNVLIDLAKRFPERKFLGVKPYYNVVKVPTDIKNIEWMDLQDDIRTVLAKTKILIVPSLYESWGRVAFEAMYNGIPVLYTKPAEGLNNYKSGSTEGMQDWIQDNGFACNRTNLDDWIDSIHQLDDPEVYSEYSDRAFKCTRDMDIFSEIPRIEQKLFEYATKYPSPNKSKGAEVVQQSQKTMGINSLMGGIRMPRQRMVTQHPVQQSVQQPVQQRVLHQPQQRMSSLGIPGGRFGMKR
jgi:glycosyltransferase involved in cell wall biosynthesis